MEISKDVRRSVLTRSNKIRSELLTAPKLLESGDIDKQIQGMEIILNAIDHIEWVDRFFYDVVNLDGKGEE